MGEEFNNSKEFILPDIKGMCAFDVLTLFFKHVLHSDDHNNNYFSSHTVSELCSNNEFLYIVYRKVDNMITNKNIGKIHSFQNKVFDFIYINKVYDLDKMDPSLYNLFNLQFAE